MKKLLLFFLFTICMSTLFAQADTEIPDSPEKSEKYLNIGPGLAIYTVRDLFMSQMTFTGAGFNIYSGFHIRKDKYHGDIDIFLNGGGVNTDAGASALVFNGQLSFTYQKKIRQLPYNIKWMAGGALNNWVALRNHSGYSNSAVIYDYFTAVSAASSVWKEFSLFDHRLMAGWQLTFPVIAFALRPSYAFIGPEPFYDYQINRLKGALQSFEMASFGSFLRIQSKFTAEYFLKNGNIVEAGYQWEYYNYDKIPVNELWAGNHIFYLATKFNF